MPSRSSLQNSHYQANVALYNQVGSFPGNDALDNVKN